MNFSDFIKDNGKRINKEHYLHLIQVSKADGKINEGELQLLHKEGRKFGLTDPEIDALIDKEKDFHYVPPYSLQEKFDEIYNIASLILADEEVSEAERKMLRRYAIAAGFDDNTIDNIKDLVIDGIRQGLDEETLFKAFKKKILER